MHNINLKLTDLAETYHYKGYVHVKDHLEDALSFYTDQFNPNTDFLLSTTNWSLLSIVALQLMEKGLLDIEQPMMTYFTDFVHGDVVKVKHLLYRNSQILDYVSGYLLNNDTYRALSPIDQLKQDYITSMQAVDNKSILAYLNTQDLLRKPGAQAEYSNSETLLLKLLIENIISDPIETYIENEIFIKHHIPYKIGVDTDILMYGQTNTHFQIPINIPKDIKKVFQLPITSINIFLQCLKDFKLYSKQTFKFAQKSIDNVCIGFFDENKCWSFEFGAGSHNVDYKIFKNQTLTMTYGYHYIGDYLFVHEYWENFHQDSERLIFSHFLTPKKPKLIEVTKHNKYELFNIILDETQYKYVPNTFKCLAYTYKDSKIKHYLFVDQGITIGMVTLDINPIYDDFSIRFLQIDKSYQNKGYGKILVDLACTKLKAFGAKKLEIGVVANNKAAYHVYKACGFVEVDVSANFIMLFKSF
ncbi:MAG: GNAT family N-acetyltransferase [Acholeplasmataceae bacterium]